MPNSFYNSNNTMTSIGGGAGSARSSYVLSNSNTTWNNNLTSTGPVIALDFVMDGVSLKDTFEKINERLAILVPDPAKMEKFAALQVTRKLFTEP